jgi:hypothetical protein
LDTTEGLPTRSTATPAGRLMTMFVVGFPVAGDHTISYVKVCSVAGVVKDVREPGTNTALVRVACRRVSEAAASNTHTHRGST